MVRIESRFPLHSFCTSTVPLLDHSGAVWTWRQIISQPVKIVNIVNDIHTDINIINDIHTDHWERLPMFMTSLNTMKIVNTINDIHTDHWERLPLFITSLNVTSS